VENSTLAWGAAALLVLVTGKPMDESASAGAAFDPDRMLDVSVSIRTISHVTVDRFGDSVWSPASGSGLLVSAARCEVWTNQHVIADAAAIEVLPRGWDAAQGIPAELVSASARDDVAVLRMRHCEGIPEAQLGDSDALRQGDELYAVGNPLGHNPDSISRGILSHAERYLNGPTPYLQTDATINPGNSGGALFDAQGRVVGISTAIATDAHGSATGIAYAIPINLVREVVAELRRGPRRWGDAGIGDLLAGLSAAEAEIFHVPSGYGAVSLSESPEAGPAAGRLFARDVIFAVNDRPVGSPSRLRRLIGGFAAGDTVTFQVVRDGRVVAVNVELAEGRDQEPVRAPDDYQGLLGMDLEMWDEAEDRERAQFKAPVIRRIHSLGPAHRGHIVSSQHTLGPPERFGMPYLLSVSEITGVVIDGRYRQVSSIEALDELATGAYESGYPLLLEIATWGRDPQDLRAPLHHVTTAFYRVMPRPSALAARGTAAAIGPLAACCD